MIESFRHLNADGYFVSTQINNYQEFASLLQITIHLF